MPRASAMMSDRVVKYDWPGTPELTVSEVSIAKRDSDEIKLQKVITNAATTDGLTWNASEPVKIEGWVAPE